MKIQMVRTREAIDWRDNYLDSKIREKLRLGLKPTPRSIQNTVLNDKAAMQHPFGWGKSKSYSVIQHNVERLVRRSSHYCWEKDPNKRARATTNLDWRIVARKTGSGKA